MFCLVISWFTSFPGLLVLAVVVGLVGAVLLYVVDMLYFLILPRWAIKKYGKTNIERLRRILERVVATPSFIGTQQKLSARCPRGDLRLTGAARRGRGALPRKPGESGRSRRLADFPALEADTRRRLADCLEAMGRPDEAENERRRAGECVDRAPAEALTHLTRGTLLERQQQYAEACAAYEQALSCTPASDQPGRIECMIQLSVASVHAGRPQEVLRWALEAIGSGATGRFLAPRTGWPASPAEASVDSKNRKTIPAGRTRLPPLRVTRPRWARFSAAWLTSSANAESSPRPTRRVKEPQPCTRRPSGSPARCRPTS